MFLLSRITEEYRAHGDTNLAVMCGLQRVGPVVTAAALIMSVVFIAMATSQVSFVKLLGRVDASNPVRRHTHSCGTHARRDEADGSRELVGASLATASRASAREWGPSSVHQLTVRQLTAQLAAN